MSELKTNKVSPATGTALQLGDSGDTVSVPSGATLSVAGSLTLPDDSVTTAKILDSNVTTAKIADNNVTLAKLDDGTQGDILYYAASGAPTRLGFGTSGDFLKTQGTGANPVWASPGGGGLIFLSKNTLSATAATWDITDCFTSTYTKYLIQVSRLQNTTENVPIWFTVGNSDLSSLSTWSYMWSGLGVNGNTFYNASLGSQSGMVLQWNLHNDVSGWSGNFWVFDPFGTTGVTRVVGQGQAYANAAAEGQWRSEIGGTAGTTSAVSMRFYASSGSVGDATYPATATLYGLAES